MEEVIFIRNIIYLILLFGPLVMCLMGEISMGWMAVLELIAAFLIPMIGSVVRNE